MMPFDIFDGLMISLRPLSFIYAFFGVILTSALSAQAQDSDSGTTIITGGTLSGTGLVLIGASDTVLSGSNSFSGSTNISTGTLVLLGAGASTPTTFGDTLVFDLGGSDNSGTISAPDQTDGTGVIDTGAIPSLGLAANSSILMGSGAYVYTGGTLTLSDTFSPVATSPLFGGDKMVGATVEVVPEPSTWLLAIGGLSLLVLLRHVRRA
jgi:fibronectin-binding autotransporter adhesin